MSELSVNNHEKISYVLHAIGKGDRYDSNTRLVDTDLSIQEAINADMDNYAARIILNMVSKFNVGFNPEKGGIIILDNSPLEVGHIVNMVDNFGMWLPQSHRGDVFNALTYVKDNTREYVQFNERTNANRTILQENDLYINPKLWLILRDEYTDFDLFSLFPYLMTGNRPFFEIMMNRRHILDKLYADFHPAGDFHITYMSDVIKVYHNVDTSKGLRLYPSNLVNIKPSTNIINGKIYNNSGQALNPVGLYQLAFKINPQNNRILYNTFVTDETRVLMDNVYKYILKNIHKMEQESPMERKRFGGLYANFNADLDKSIS